MKKMIRKKKMVGFFSVLTTILIITAGTCAETLMAAEAAEAPVLAETPGAAETTDEPETPGATETTDEPETPASESAGFQTLSEEEAISLCSGTFIQHPEENGTGKTYTAEVSFYYKDEELYCSVNYSNYAGELKEAPAERIDEEDYCFFTAPEGKLFTRSQEFAIWIGPEKLHIQWGEGVCDYVLDRGTGALSELNSTGPDFLQTDTGSRIIGQLDEAFGEFDHSYAYDAEEKTFYMYIAIRKGLRTAILEAPDVYEKTWAETLKGFQDISETYAPVVDLASRQSMKDFLPGHFTVMVVEELNEKNEYIAPETLGIVTDGKVIYDILKDIRMVSGKTEEKEDGFPIGNNTGNAGRTTGNQEVAADRVEGYSAATTGEKNALRAAENYLNVMAFSYTGLIDQLEYEGYSYSEAVYGADHCGADWFEQAARSARQYLNLMPFSYSELVEQLEYEGFTHAQAVYGADQNY